MTSVPPVPQWAPPRSTPAPTAPAPGPVARPLHRGRALFWTALGLLIGGAVLLLVGFGGLVADATLPDDYPVVDVPGTRQVELTAGATYTIYVETPADIGAISPPDVVVTSPSGDVEPLVEPVLAEETYDRGRYTGRTLAGLAPTLTGTYRITTSWPEGATDTAARIAVGESTIGTASLVGVTLMALGVLVLLGGLGVGIAWLVRRDRETPAEA